MNLHQSFYLSNNSVGNKNTKTEDFNFKINSIKIIVIKLRFISYDTYINLIYMYLNGCINFGLCVRYPADRYMIRLSTATYA